MKKTSPEICLLAEITKWMEDIQGSSAGALSLHTITTIIISTSQVPTETLHTHNSSVICEAHCSWWQPWEIPSSAFRQSPERRNHQHFPPTIQPIVLFVYLLRTCCILKPLGGCFLWILHASSDIGTPYGFFRTPYGFFKTGEACCGH